MTLVAAGFEAKAIVTADMSGFVRASRQATEAAQSLANALRDVNAQLNSISRNGRDVAQALTPLIRANQQVAQAQDQTNQANQRTQAQLRTLARAWINATDDLETLNAAMASGTRNQENIARSLSTAQRVYSQISEEIAGLTDEQRRNLDQSAEELRLRQQVRSAIQDTAQALQFEGRQRELSQSQLRSMGTEMANLAERRRALVDIQRRQGALDTQQIQQLTQLRARLRTLTAEYATLNETQRQVADQSRILASTQRGITQANRELAQSERQTAQAARESAAAQQLSESAARRMAQSLVNLSDQQRQFQQLQASSGQLTQAQADGLDAVNDSLDRTRQAYDRLNSAQRAQVDSAQAQLERASALSSAQRELSASTAQAQRATQSLASSQQELTQNTFGWREALEDASFALQSLSQAIFTQLGQAVAVFREQEAAMAQFARITAESDTIVGAFTERFREMSTVIPIATQELAQIATFGGQIGVSVAALEEFTETVAMFSATTGVAADEASILIGRILELTDTPENEIDNLGSAISALGSSSAATELQILRVAEQISAVSTEAGLSNRSIVGLASSLASLGIRPELARGALQRVLLQIGDAAQSSGQRTDQFARIIGRTDESMRQLAATNPEQLFFEFLEGLNSASRGMGNAEEAGQNLNSTLAQLGFTSVQDRQLLTALGANWGFVSEQLGIANREYERNSFLQEESARIFGTVDASLTKTANAWGNLQSAVVQALGPIIRAAADAATAFLLFVQRNDQLVAALAGLAVVAGVVGALAALGGALLAVQAGVAALTASLPPATGLLASLGVAGRVTAASLGLLASAARLIPWVALASLIGIAVNELSQLGETAVEANADFIAAAGGIDGLSAALNEDTAALAAGNDEMVLRIGRLGALSAAEREEANAIDDSTLGHAALNRELGNFNEVTSQSTSELTQMGDAADGVLRVVGSATQEWARAAAEAQLLASGVLDSAESFNAFNNALADVGGVSGTIDQELMEVGAGVDAVDGAIVDLTDTMGFWENAWNDFIFGLSRITFGLLDFRTANARTRDALVEYRDGLEGTSGALEEAGRRQALFGEGTALTEAQAEALTGTMVDLGDGTTIAGEALTGAADDTALLDATINGMTITLNDAIGAFSAIIDPATVWADLTSEAASAAESAGDSFTRLGADALPEFNQRMSESGDLLLQNVDNLLRISEEAGPDVAQALIEMGDAGVDLGFALVEALDTGQIDDFDAAVSNLGLDTQLAVQSIVESFALISSATGDVREEAEGIFDDLLAQDLDVTEFASRLQEQLAGVEGLEVEADITAALDAAQITEELRGIGDILEAWAEENGIEIEGEVDVEEPEIPPIELPPADTQGFVDSIRTAVQGSGAEFESQFLTRLQTLQSQFDQNQIDPTQFLARVIQLTEEFDLDVDIPAELRNDEELRAELEALGFDLETIANTSNPQFVPLLNGVPAEQDMILTAGLINRTADEADPTITPSTNAAPAEQDFGGMILGMNNRADEAEPTVEPVTDARNALIALANAIAEIVSVARSARPTITPVINTSVLVAGVRAVIRALSAIPRSISVSVRAYVGSTVSRGQLLTANTGGWVPGTGSPNVDKVPSLLAPREFVVNATAAQAWAPLLELINSGARPNPSILTGTVERQPTLSRFDSSLMPSLPSNRNELLSDSIRRAQAQPLERGPATVINVQNTYPRAEPTSVTINRSMAYGKLLEGTTL